MDSDKFKDVSKSVEGRDLINRHPKCHPYDFAIVGGQILQNFPELKGMAPEAAIPHLRGLILDQLREERIEANSQGQKLLDVYAKLIYNHFKVDVTQRSIIEDSKIFYDFTRKGTLNNGIFRDVDTALKDENPWKAGFDEGDRSISPPFIAALSVMKVTDNGISNYQMRSKPLIGEENEKANRAARRGMYFKEAKIYSDSKPLVDVPYLGSGDVLCDFIGGDGYSTINPQLVKMMEAEVREHFCDWDGFIPVTEYNLSGWELQWVIKIPTVFLSGIHVFMRITMDEGNGPIAHSFVFQVRGKKFPPFRKYPSKVMFALNLDERRGLVSHDT